MSLSLITSADPDLRLWLPFDGPRCGLRGLIEQLDDQGRLPAVVLTTQPPTPTTLHHALAHTWRMGGHLPGLGHALWGVPKGWCTRWIRWVRPTAMAIGL